MSRKQEIPHPLSDGKVACHDGSPYCNYICECGFEMHTHLTQMPPGYEGMELRTFCKGCGAELVLPRPRWIGLRVEAS